MANFEDRLLVELQQHHPDPTRAVARDRSGAFRTGAAAALLAACALVLPAALGGEQAAPAAYAMTVGTDGSVTFTLLELRDLDSATRALRKAGVPAVVRAASTSCTDTSTGERAPDALLEWPVGGDARSVRIHPAAMPPGRVLGLTAISGKSEPVVKVLLYDAPGPSCFPLGKPAK